MANDPQKPDLDDVIIDASDVEEFLEDLEEGGLRGLLSEGEGIDEVL